MWWEGGKAEVITAGKYEIIHNTVSQDNNLLSITKMCEIAGVPRSGYYSWIDAAPYREQCEIADKADFEKIVEAYKHSLFYIT